MSELSRPASACLVVIGNEILSGRTQDLNIRFLATRLGELGLPLREVRIIPDIAETIIDTVNEMRARHDHVLTTGGIGPTHDDITSPCVAEAVGVPWEPHAPTWAKMKAHYPPGEFNAARQRMATLPRGAIPIETTLVIAPGFSIANVHVMAGVPRIMQAQFESLAPSLGRGLPVVSRSVHAAGLQEGRLAEGLASLQQRHGTLDLGSYPFERADLRGVAVVAKGTDPDRAEAAIWDVTALMLTLGAAPVQGEPPA